MTKLRSKPSCRAAIDAFDAAAGGAGVTEIAQQAARKFALRYELTGFAELIGLAVAIPVIYFGLGTVSRWISLQADRWDDDGVIRGFPKLWRDESPKRFAAILSYYRFNAIFWWAVARFLPVLLGLILFVKLLIIAYNSVWTR